MHDGSKPTTPPTDGKGEDWRELATKACQEQEPRKLAEPVQRLCDALDIERSRRKSDARDTLEPPTPKA